MTDRYRTTGAHRTVRRSRSSSSARRANWRLWIAGGLLAVAIVFGGGGTPSPMTELIVELAALVAIVAWVWLSANDRRYSAGRIDWPLYAVAALFVAIPVLQLIPLPPSIWHNLPGREVEIQALALVGRDNAWMPWSVSPPRTIASALSLIPPLAMLVMVSRLRQHDRVRVIGLVAALGLAAAVVGVVQLASGHANWLRFYAFTHYGFATGFQANRNADSDILLIATMALTAWVVIGGEVRQSRQLQLIVGALVLFMVLSVVLTGSRAGVALLAIAIIASVAMTIRPTVTRNWRVAAAAALGVAVLVGGTYSLSENARVQRTLSRFDRSDAVSRPEIWEDTVYAIGQYWPAGAGIGTFQPVFAGAERLEFVRPDFSNRAHNDYLEFVLEAGVAAPVVLVLAIVFAGIRLWRLLVGNGRTPLVIGILVLGSVLVLLLHSLVDYPERSLSLAVLGGVLGGLMGRCGEVRGRMGSAEGVAG